MKITNRTSIPTTKLRRMVEYALSHTPRSCVARIEFLESVPGQGLDGQAYILDPDPKFNTDPGHLSLIRVWVSYNNPLQYPEVQEYAPGVKVRFSSYDEELLHTIAHEMCHIRQFVLTPWWQVSAEAKEVEAELFAIDVVQSWLGRSEKRAA